MLTRDKIIQGLSNFIDNSQKYKSAIAQSIFYFLVHVTRALKVQKNRYGVESIKFQVK